MSWWVGDPLNKFYLLGFECIRNLISPSQYPKCANTLNTPRYFLAIVSMCPTCCLMLSAQHHVIKMTYLMCWFSSFTLSKYMIVEVIKTVRVSGPNVIHWRVTLCYETNLSGYRCLKKKYMTYLIWTREGSLTRNIPLELPTMQYMWIHFY